MKTFIAPIFLALGLTTFVVQAQDQLTADVAPQVELEQCYLKGIAEQLRCGTLQVPENYAEPDGKTISINFAVLPAVRESKQNDPLLILAGGPGQAATELANMIEQAFQSVRQQRDILLIDQRGTGKSHPLSCSMSHVEELVKTDEAIDLAEVAAQCLAKFEDTDLTQYHSVNAIRDFEAVRAALGYQQVNLYGGSYGSRAGLIYMREAPESVRSAVLDAVAPVQVVVGPFGRHGAESFARLVQRCAASQVCNSTFPGLGATYTELMAQLEANPVPLTVRDPLTNEPIEILVTAGRFSSVMRVGLYHPTTRQMLPYVIERTANGDYTPLTGLFGSTMAQSELYMGLTLSVLCSEDLSRVTPELLAADGDNTFIGSRTGDAFIDMCSVWPQQQRPDAWFEPVNSAIPTLLLSGDLDPVTPPAWGDMAAETLSNSRHLIAPQGAHTIVGHTCANKLASQFIKDLDLEALDASCLTKQRPQPFILNSNGKGL
ncbi:alpha/beta hydrolase [Pseudidiomarina sp. E22-M8]|uniref:alpha/beta hydrolase n=1 Tax=Pseudidiomarina sp. E22-M8 TaxID=3424768 RepID=UPI00403CE83B